MSLKSIGGRGGRLGGAGPVNIHMSETDEMTRCWANAQLKRVALGNWAVDNLVEMEEGMK